MRYLLFFLFTLLQVPFFVNSATARESEFESAADAVRRKISFGSVNSHGGTDDVICDTAVVVPNQDAQISSIGGGILDFKFGEVFIEAKRPTLVRCAEYDVWIPSGAMVLATASEGLLKVRNVYDEHKNVILYVNDRTVQLKCGQEAVAGPNSKSVKHEIANDFIVRRAMHFFEFAQGTSMFCSEFHCGALFKQSGVLSRVIRTDTRIKRKLLKTAASLSIVGAAHGPYMRVSE